MHKTYRTDIDGLRAFSVIAVILFHLGYMPNGYLGVDIFFVISGYLITCILYNEVLNENFSLWKFYEKRLRRIVPLVLVITSISLVLGVFLMLPDDLENLCQSIVATNFFGNNILATITSKDYWAIKNEYKPLIHTWSLGVEEQFYLIYPLIFLGFTKRSIRFMLPVLVGLTFLSLYLFIINDNKSTNFYFLQFRFFELSFGGICSIVFSRNEKPLDFAGSKYVLFAFIVGLFVLICFGLGNYSHQIKVLATVLFSAGVVVLGEIHFQNSLLYKATFTNNLIAWIGKISFSLYMWHQMIMAFSRYAFLEKITTGDALLMVLLIVMLSTLTYYFIESPARRQSLKLKVLLPLLGVLFILVTGTALAIYMIGGIIKDVPQLGIKMSDGNREFNFFDRKNNIHIRYNEEVSAWNRSFELNNKIKVLVLGDSYGRDFTNVLLASSFKDTLNISYLDVLNLQPNKEALNRISEADHIFYCVGFAYSTKEQFVDFMDEFRIDDSKLTMIGTKDFGYNNGIHYNKLNEKTNCNEYRTNMKGGVVVLNNKLKQDWKDKYVDLIELVRDDQDRVLVFTPECKFISQDTQHFTRFGASYFACLLYPSLRDLLKITKSP